MNQKYPNLQNFFVAYLSDADLDDDIEIAQKFGTNAPVPAVSQVLEECLELQKERPFPWQQIVEESNRYFKQESDAYEWFEEIFLTLKSSIEERLKL